MNKSKGITISILFMIFFGIFSKSLGLFREIFIASKFGSGYQTDTFFLAIAGVGLFTSMLTLSINTSIIPVLTEIESKEGKNKKTYHINNLLNIIVILSLVIASIAWVLSPYIISIMGAGFSEEQYKLAVNLMRIGVPGIVFASIIGVFRGYLQYNNLFIESSTSELPYNITFLIYLIFLTGYYGIYGLMVASVLAIGLQFILQIKSLRKINYKYYFTLNFKDKYFIKILYLVGPILISVSINDLNKIVDRTLASGLVVGSISALNYSARINSLVLAILITAISTVLFPVLTKSALGNDKTDFKKLIINGTNIILILIIPITLITIILSENITSVLFERGEFDSKDSYMTSNALIFYTIGLIGMALRTYYEKAFFALHDTRTPMVNGIITVLLNILLNIILIGPLEYKGLALATSISTLLTTVLLFYGLKRKIGRIELSEIFICFFKTIISSLIMGIIVYFYKISFMGHRVNLIYDIISLLFICIIALIVYIVILYLMKSKELKYFTSLLKNK